MNIKETNPSANVPVQDGDEPLGDRGNGDKTWTPRPGEQGISNRPDDEAADADLEDDVDDADDEDEDEDDETAETDEFDDEDEDDEEEEEDEEDAEKTGP
jgi:hypothetical protein